MPLQSNRCAHKPCTTSGGLARQELGRSSAAFAASLALFVAQTILDVPVILCLAVIHPTNKCTKSLHLHTLNHSITSLRLGEPEVAMIPLRKLHGLLPDQPEARAVPHRSLHTQML